MHKNYGTPSPGRFTCAPLSNLHQQMKTLFCLVLTHWPSSHLCVLLIIFNCSVSILKLFNFWIGTLSWVEKQHKNALNKNVFWGVEISKNDGHWAAKKKHHYSRRIVTLDPTTFLLGNRSHTVLGTSYIKKKSISLSTKWSCYAGNLRLSSWIAVLLWYNKHTVMEGSWKNSDRLIKVWIYIFLGCYV